MAEFRVGWLDLLALPLALPLRAAWTGLEQAVDLARRQADRESRLPPELADLQAALETGEITPERYLQGLAGLSDAPAGMEPGLGMSPGPGGPREGEDGDGAVDRREVE